MNEQERPFTAAEWLEGLGCHDVAETSLLRAFLAAMTSYAHYRIEYFREKGGTGDEWGS